MPDDEVGRGTDWASDLLEETGLEGIFYALALLRPVLLLVDAWASESAKASASSFNFCSASLFAFISSISLAVKTFGQRAFFFTNYV
jgi:hypothetical protein